MRATIFGDVKASIDVENREFAVLELDRFGGSGQHFFDAAKPHESCHR
jgi:hypothetical protein